MNGYEVLALVSGAVVAFGIIIVPFPKDVTGAQWVVITATAIFSMAAANVIMGALGAR